MWVPHRWRGPLFHRSFCFIHLSWVQLRKMSTRWEISSAIPIFKVTHQTVLSIIVGRNIIFVKISHFSKLYYITFPNCKCWLRFLSFLLPSFQRCHGTSHSSKHYWVWWAINSKKKGPGSISLDLLLPFLTFITTFTWPYN